MGVMISNQTWLKVNKAWRPSDQDNPTGRNTFKTLHHPCHSYPFSSACLVEEASIHMLRRDYPSLVKLGFFIPGMITLLLLCITFLNLPLIILAHGGSLSKLQTHQIVVRPNALRNFEIREPPVVPQSKACESRPAAFEIYEARSVYTCSSATAYHHLSSLTSPYQLWS
ncbi:hypothetical protein PGT21_029783 [Puccinia graminis f. sp. tritici]|uniref:Uncharacterized protein n=1 Tax=Puccinia graminis f. sp. tritici TaxID=56615 RepID=A0A5B0Q6Y0_PUCGR|nr:hypothetical protein PGT21_029783 [Puccinia graminis f. sp. tritici]KAA1122466.1 hypothetical protein PGTUg99_037657 [Puccinia graminis f. sp. tritici]